MEFNDSPEINPFVPTIPKYPLTKPRARPKNNPFQFGRNDSSELSFKTTIKSKPRPKYYPQLEFNPFKGNERVPFRRDEDRVPPVNQGLKTERRISKNKRSNDEDNRDNKNLRPNINIYYICDGNLFNNSPFQNRNIHCQPESNKREKEKKEMQSIFNAMLKKKEKEKERDNIMDNDAPAPAIAPNDPVSDLSDNFEKMKLADKFENPFKIILNNEKKNDERIFTNNNEDHLGDYYID